MQTFCAEEVNLWGVSDHDAADTNRCVVALGSQTSTSVESEPPDALRHTDVASERTIAQRNGKGSAVGARVNGDRGV